MPSPPFGSGCVDWESDVGVATLSKIKLAALRISAREASAFLSCVGSGVVSSAPLLRRPSLVRKISARENEEGGFALTFFAGTVGGGNGAVLTTTAEVDFPSSSSGPLS